MGERQATGPPLAFDTEAPSRAHPTRSLSVALLHEAVLAELKRTAEQYDDKLVGLGAELVHEVDRTLESIGRGPRTYSRVSGFGGEVRRAIISRFPFSIAYVILPSEFVVLAIAHMKRRPGYWRSRLQ